MSVSTSWSRHAATKDRIQPRSHRVGRARWVWMNRPHLISARTSGRRPSRLICPGHHGAGRGGTPPTKRRLVGVVDRNRPAELFKAVPPRRRQPRAAGPFVTVVAAGMPRAQAKRRVGQVGADRHPTGPVAGKGQLLTQPRGQVGGFAVGLLVVLPSAQVPLTQPQLGMGNWPLGAHPAGQFLGPHMALQTRCRAEKRSLTYAALAFARPLPQMLRAQIRPARARSLTVVHHTFPAIDRVLARDLDHIRAKDRIERRAGDQGSENLQPVPTNPIRAILIHKRQPGAGVAAAHRPSPHTVRSAASKSGSCTSTWP